MNTITTRTTDVLETSSRRAVLGSSLRWGFGALAAGTLLGAVRRNPLTMLSPSAANAAGTASPPSPPDFPPVNAGDLAEWAIFKQRFIAGGRVIDNFNGGISHSEGQGYGLLFAVAFDDRETFDRLLDWTETTLARSEDHLHRWRFDQRLPNPLDDPNNASDGDIFIAWALWKAAFRWNEPRYATLSRAIATDLLDNLVVRAGERTLLLPGIQGFDHADATTINLSYVCFPALRELAHAVPDLRWNDVQESALAMIEDGRFGKWMLPPDWLNVSHVDGSLSPAYGRPARFSADAIRIPLFLAWGRRVSPAVRQSFTSFWSQTAPATPAWVDVMTGVEAPYATPAGMQAVATLASKGPQLANAAWPPLRSTPDYYGSALILLSRLAARQLTA